MGDRSAKSQKGHWLIGKPSNNRKPKSEQATRNIGFRANEERWQKYHDAAEVDEKKLTRWLVDMADARVKELEDLGKMPKTNNDA